MITHKNTLVALLLLTSFIPAKSMFELPELDGQVLATSAHTISKQESGDTCPTLPDDILNMIFEYLPAENEFLNQWIRTHNPSPALIIKMVDAYVDSHFETALTIDNALQKHFTLFHQNSVVKKDVDNKLRQAFKKATFNDTQRFTQFVDNFNPTTRYSRDNLYNLDNALFGKEQYNPYLYLRSDKLQKKLIKLKNSGNLTALEKAIIKDIQFINACLGYFNSIIRVSPYIRNKFALAYYNKIVLPAAITYAETYLPTYKAFLSWTVLLGLTLFKPTKQADTITCIKFAFRCCSAMIALNMYPAIKALFISGRVGFYGAKHRLLSRMLNAFPASTHFLLDTLLDTRGDLLRLKNEVDLI